MSHPDLSMSESSTSESELVFLDAFDDIGTLDILSLNLSRDGRNTDGHKVLGSAFEIILTVIYACLAFTGLISNTALMGIILGELKLHYAELEIRNKNIYRGVKANYSSLSSLISANLIGWTINKVKSFFLRRVGCNRH